MMAGSPLDLALIIPSIGLQVLQTERELTIDACGSGAAPKRVGQGCYQSFPSWSEVLHWTRFFKQYPGLGHRRGGRDILGA